MRALVECDRVVVSAGRTYKIAPVLLPSHRVLELQDGSTLVGSDEWSHYGTTRFMPPMGSAMQLRPLLSAVNATNVTIEGGNGTIDGNGWFAWPATNWSSPECGVRGHCAADVFFGEQQQQQKLRPPHVLTFIRCTDVLLRNITIKNPPFWGVQHFFCNRSTSSHVTILAPRWTREIAGLMPWSVLDYAVEDSYIHVGDDAVAIMSGTDEAGQLWPTARMVFRRYGNPPFFGAIFM
jgi:polygalacturonase